MFIARLAFRHRSIGRFGICIGRQAAHPGGGSEPRRCIGIAHKMETFATSAATASPIVELRQYKLHPSQTALYTQQTVASAPLRKNLPLAFFGVPETGAIQLNTAVHLYHYPGGHVERSEKRAALAKKDEWKEYLGKVKACMVQQSSEIFVEAPLVNDLEEVKGMQHWIGNDASVGSNSSKGIVELRKYQLQLGYDTVPKFLELYGGALPSELAADGTHPTTELASILVNDVGRLNTVYEVWTHGGGVQAMEQSRQASRGASEWRKAIGEIAELAVTFDTTILKPLPFSPLQ